MVLLDYIKDFENKSSRERGRQVKTILQMLGIAPIMQVCHYPKITNIIVDFNTNPGSKRLLLSAHYDVVSGSPGANDNASGVAVLLGLCQYLKEEPAPVRIVFFDREESWLRIPVLHLGLLGSLYYVIKTNLHNVSAVYNLELVGRGDCLCIWPVKEKERNRYAVKEVEGAAEQMKIPHLTAHIPWFILSSDHLSFRLKGLVDAVSLSLLPGDQIPLWKNILARASADKILSGWRPQLPEPLSLIHSSRDNSYYIDENSLQLAFSLLRNLIMRNCQLSSSDS